MNWRVQRVSRQSAEELERILRPFANFKRQSAGSVALLNELNDNGMLAPFRMQVIFFSPNFGGVAALDPGYGLASQRNEPSNENVRAKTRHAV